MQSAKRAALLFKALNTAGKVFRASDILFSNIQFIQLRRTSSLRAELLTKCLVSWTNEICGPIGTIRGCDGLNDDNLCTISINSYNMTL